MRAPVRWSRIVAGIAVVVLLAIPCLIGAVAAGFIGTGMLRTGLRYLTWGLLLGVFVFAGLGTLLILWGTVRRGTTQGFDA